MRSRHVVFAAKFAVSGGLIWYLLSNLDLAKTADRFMATNPLWLGTAIALVLVLTALGGLRWHAVMRPLEKTLPVVESLRLFYIGTFFNQTLPSSVGGDAVRMYLGYKRGLPVAQAVSSVILERVVTVVSLVIVIDIVFPGFVGRIPTDHPLAPVLLPGLVVLNIGALTGVGLLVFMNAMPESLRHIKLLRGIGKLGSDARRLFLSPAALAYAMSLGMIGQLMIGLVAFLTARAMGIDVALTDCLVLIPLVLLTTTIPISIAGWGVRESAMVVAFALVGLPAESAVSISLMLGLIALAVALPGGLVWLRLGEHVDETFIEHEIENDNDDEAPAAAPVIKSE